MSKLKPIKSFKYFVLVLMGLAMLPAVPIFAESTQIIDRIVAVVNDDIITLSELNHIVAPYIKEIKATRYPADRERKEIFTIRDKALDRLIDSKLEEQEIKAAGITVTDKEVNGTIENIKRNNSVTDEELRKMLAGEGLTMEVYREQVEKQILKSKLMNYQVKSKIIVTKEDINAYYETHQDEFSEEGKYHLRHIIMRVPKYATDSEKKAIYSQMEKLHEKLEQGASFERLAREHSESSLAVKGGDLGLIKTNILSREIQAALEGLTAGQYTGILDTDQGLQVFYVEKAYQFRVKPLEEVSPIIEKKLFNAMLDKAHEAWFSDHRKKSHIIKKL